MASLKDQIRQFLESQEGGTFQLDASRDGELSDQLATAMGKTSSVGVAKALIELISTRDLETVKKGGVVTIVRLPARNRVSPVFSDMSPGAAAAKVSKNDPWHVALTKALTALRQKAGENLSVGAVLREIGLDKRQVEKAMADLRVLDVYKTRRYAFGKSTYDLTSERTSVTLEELAVLKNRPVAVDVASVPSPEPTAATSDLLVLVAELTTRLEAAQQDSELRQQLEEEVAALRAENAALKAKLAQAEHLPDELRDRLHKLGINQ